MIRESDLLIGLALALVGLLFSGFAASKFLLGRVQISVVLPDSATVGDQFAAKLDVTSRSSMVVGVEVWGSETHGLRAPNSGMVTATARSPMGRYGHVPVRLHTWVPDGLVASFSVRAVKLAQPFYVLPAAVRCDIGPTPPALGAHSDPAGEMAGLRDYALGDRIRDVHWPSLARTSTLMVRDTRSSVIGGSVTVQVQPTSETQRELVGGYARHAVRVLLARGCQVTLRIGNESVVVTDEIAAAKCLCVLPVGVPTESVPGRVLVISAERGATWLDQA